MSKVDPKDNIRFLVVCINNSTNGKPNFEAVAKEFDIVSKGAAAKRYERLLKSCGVSASGKATTTTAAVDDDGDDEPAKPTPKKRKAPATPKAASPAVKKAKATPRGKKAQAKAEEDDEAEEVDVKAESESSLSEPPEDTKDKVKAEN